MTENSLSRVGVVRAMARSDHCRWVSTPRWARVSWNVTSSCQRHLRDDRYYETCAREAVSALSTTVLVTVEASERRGH